MEEHFRRIKEIIFAEIISILRDRLSTKILAE
jgi:hypothetical protein